MDCFPDRQKQQDQKDRFGKWQADVSILPRMNQGPIPSDVLGSYTGTGADDLEPVQDADDL